MVVGTIIVDDEVVIREGNFLTYNDFLNTARQYGNPTIEHVGTLPDGSEYYIATITTGGGGGGGGDEGEYYLQTSINVSDVFVRDADINSYGVIRYQFSPQRSGTYTFKSNTRNVDTIGWIGTTWNMAAYAINANGYPGNEDYIVGTYKDDDYGRAFSATAELESPGPYYLWVLCYGGNSGTVELELSYEGGGGGGGGSASVSLNIRAGEIVPVTVYFANAGTYTFETEGDLDTYGYLSYASVSDVVTNSSGKKEPSSYLTYNDDVTGTGTNNFRIEYSVSGGTAYKIWVRFYSVSTSGTVTLKITPAVGTFYGKMTTNGKTAANINALFENGDPVYSNYRYIRLKINGSWTKINGSTYTASISAGGASSTFSVTKTGLNAGTTYTYEVHLYYRSGSSYIDTGFYISGSFTTDQDASAIMLYHNGWKNAIPYIYTGGAWHRCSSRLYLNGWKS